MQCERSFRVIQTSIEAALNLSQLQIGILLWIEDATVLIESELGWLHLWGVYWAFSQDENFGDYSEPAISRSLQRLESRGLLLRNNLSHGIIRSFSTDTPPSRTTHVRLTRIGRDVAEMIEATLR